MRGRGLLCGIALSLLLRPPRRGEVAAGSEPQPVVVVPRWEAPGSPGGEKHPFRAEVKIEAGGQELVLELEKNDTCDHRLAEMCSSGLRTAQKVQNLSDLTLGAIQMSILGQLDLIRSSIMSKPFWPHPVSFFFISSASSPS